MEKISSLFKKGKFFYGNPISLSKVLAGILEPGDSITESLERVVVSFFDEWDLEIHSWKNPFYADAYLMHADYIQKKASIVLNYSKVNSEENVFRYVVHEVLHLHPGIDPRRMKDLYKDLNMDFQDKETQEEFDSISKNLLKYFEKIDMSIESLVMDCEEKICSKGKESNIWYDFEEDIYLPQKLEEIFFGVDPNFPHLHLDPFKNVFEGQLDLFRNTFAGRCISDKNGLGFKKNNYFDDL